MSDVSARSELHETWEAAAPGWAKWEQAFSRGFSDATETLIDMADVGSGMRVLDLACGAGNQTLQLAKRVGPSGRVVASDISGTMLAYVRQSAKRAGLQNIETIECAAEELNETGQPFDGAISRLGLMLFPAPRDALESVQRVLRVGARFSALVFTTPSQNPFLSQSMGILRRHAGKPTPPPGSPGLFALGPDGALETLLRTSGLLEVRTQILRVPLELPNVAATLEMMQEAFGAYRAVIADLDEEKQRAAWVEVAEFLKQFEVGGHFETDMEIVVGSGAKPS